MPYSYRSRSRSFSGRHSHTSQRPARRGNNKELINPARFIKAAAPAQVETFTAQHRFADFAMHELLQANIQTKGFTTPSPIQDQAIPVGLAGNDVVGVANTGTGKTVAFAVPVLHALLADRSARALILAPTRELAMQIEAECRQLAKGSGFSGALLIGGSSMTRQLDDLRRRPAIVIGTPGRTKDHLQRGSLDLSNFGLLVLDEVDRMLDMGFVNDVRWILGKMPAKRQSFFFTATLDYTVSALIHEFSHQPITISVKAGDTTDTVEQEVVRYGDKAERMNHLHDLLLRAPKALIFDDTKYSVERLSKELQTRGFLADAIHGGKSQSQRQRALNRFKANEVNVLVATDVAARGLDISDITHVINFAPPRTYDDYVHRIGRAGRAGRRGYAFTFVER